MDSYLSLIEYGAIGVMLVIFIKMYRGIYRDYKELITQSNKERKEMYEKMTDMVAEVTRTLTENNNRDEQLTKVIGDLVDAIKEDHEA